ncbi:hypothetical protein JOC77_000880 [Peribacillus deserti]|uniref:DUF1806 domain-containing protein n=1 Tax=Peribacillus deserti TaxID=673318 RepID=A0ABS2QE83_9BACI|nr:hypothetical protein [Peribacillus deserti]MBM7691475.1 hypothetical protein [Peribacillus deserti]
MSNNYYLSTSDFPSLQVAARELLKIISMQLDVNSAYIAKKSLTEMTVLSSFNKEEQIIPEGYSVEYGGTYCRLVITNKEEFMLTSDLSTFDLTKELEVTEQLGTKGFLGVTLKDRSGNVHKNAWHFQSGTTFVSSIEQAI